MRASRHHPAQRGFSLIELMVVVTVTAVMLGIGVPAFKQFTATQRVKSAAVDLATTLLQARSEAIKRNVAVTIAHNTGGWAYGWTVVAGTVTVAEQAALGDVTVTANPTSASVVYSGNGRITAGSSVKFQVGSSDTTQVRCVTVSPSGVASTTSTSCS
jgi:type IV fimbrial biogenesis protein FimT